MYGFSRTRTQSFRDDSEGQAHAVLPVVPTNPAVHENGKEIGRSLKSLNWDRVRQWTHLVSFSDIRFGYITVHPIRSQSYSARRICELGATDLSKSLSFAVFDSSPNSRKGEFRYRHFFQLAWSLAGAKLLNHESTRSTSRAADSDGVVAESQTQSMCLMVMSPTPIGAGP